MNSLAIHNASVLTPFSLIPSGSVHMEGEYITYVGETVNAPPRNDVCKTLDARGLFLAPGFIDIHVHGGGGSDFMDGTDVSARNICRAHSTGGTTSLLATTLTSSPSRLDQGLATIETLSGSTVEGVRLLGAHLEGPHVSSEYAGAQNPAFVSIPNPTEYRPLLDQYACIKRVTLAPEIEGADTLARELHKRGIVVSAGHSGARYQDMLTALEAGYTHVTHLYSGMSGVTKVHGYRVTGLVESALLLDELTVELIADGHHLPPSLMKLVVKAKGVSRTALITDAISLAGTVDTEGSLEGLEVIVTNDVPDEFEIKGDVDVGPVAKLSDKPSFAGSVSLMNRVVRIARKYAGVSLREAVEMATATPAGILGYGDIGVLRQGAKADAVLFDENLSIVVTFVDGQIAYKNSEVVLDLREVDDE